jgi:predicted phage terminase large subunit-like protein
VEFPTLKQKVAELADQWRPSEIYIEDRASGQSLIQELKLATSYPVIPVKVDKDKETRASAVTGYFEAGKVLFPQPETAKWVADLEDELASFPGGLHDDCVDAISQALNRMRDAGGVLGLLEHVKRTVKEIAEGIRDRFAELVNPKPEPKPIVIPKPAVKVETRVEGFQLWLKTGQAPACTACGATCTTYNSSRKIFCNQCHAVDGKLPDTATVCDCGNFLPQYVAGLTRCGNCGWQSVPTAVVVGMSRKDYAVRHSRFGRFG